MLPVPLRYQHSEIVMWFPNLLFITKTTNGANRTSVGADINLTGNYMILSSCTTYYYSERVCDVCLESSTCRHQPQTRGPQRSRRGL